MDKVRVLCWACVNLRVAQLQEEESALWRYVTKSVGKKVRGLSVSLPPPPLPHWPYQYTVHTPEAVRVWKSVVFHYSSYKGRAPYILFLEK